ncbi:unnamed protein product (macronuclear) [Paramecium tetraurelia]|uniref:Transmembrane protein n=1 Tax=Paramecium tetraurelia TaxID=5888 RepID=A0CII6_PARTE|nr:uncharacterized protein GSPATT00007738001 [Paramecium tetraurelia]CAK70603.1 unnamed protein product [Paramecium tetraurelia]|eukprot:XP_001438000.1 hypothetical protein (macronuclear) [Paramecium tetraurelia strain d4-2]
MQNFIPRYFYYQKLSQHMKIRKTLDRENRKPKKWLQNYFVPFIPKWTQRIVDNKKKSIFFLLCLGLFTYYEGFQCKIAFLLFSDLHHKILYREPFKSKLDRWIFKVKNLPKQSLVEFQPITTLNQNTIEQLKEIYLKYESEMKYGMSRKLMFEVYESLNLFQKDEERIGFYRQSGYYKKRNQKVSSVHFQQFVKIFEDALKKLNKKGNTITESELVSQFIQLCSDKQSEKWENKIQQKRAEFVKLLPELQDQKQALIRQMLSENPYVTEEHIQQELENKGLYGLGTKDKLQIYDLQLSLHKVLLDSKKAKLYNSMLFGQSTLSAQKEKKLRDKIMIEEEKVNQLQAKRNEVAEKDI